jgi:hypothetical protein
MAFANIIMLVTFLMLEGAHSVRRHEMNAVYNMECECNWYGVRVVMKFITDAHVQYLIHQWKKYISYSLRECFYQCLRHE